jgi:hypothetical protein
MRGLRDLRPLWLSIPLQPKQSTEHHFFGFNLAKPNADFLRRELP